MMFLITPEQFAEIRKAEHRIMRARNLNTEEGRLGAAADNEALREAMRTIVPDLPTEGHVQLVVDYTKLVFAPRKKVTILDLSEK